MVDYKKLTRDLKDEDIINMMKHLGADRYEDKENWIVFPTICHNDLTSDASMKLYWYKNNKFFMCYTECGGMSIFQFLKHYYESRGISYNWKVDVLDFIIEVSGQSFVQLNTKKELPYGESLADRYARGDNIGSLKTYNEGVLGVFSKFYPPEWINEGITTNTMIKYEIGYSIQQNKIVIPHRGINGDLVGIRGRALDAWEIKNIGKYMPIQVEGQWYSHPLSLNLYGLDKNKDNIKKYGIVYLFEGEKSVLITDSFRLPNVGVAVCGSNINRYQLNLLRALKPKEVVICFDKEADTDRITHFNKLYKMAEKYKNEYDFSFIYDTDGLLDLKDSPVDKGEKVFRTLLKKRVMVR